MFLYIHIALAMLSIVFSLINVFYRQQSVQISIVGLAIGTGISGIILAWQNPGSLGHICLSGTFFTVFLFVSSRISIKRLLNTAQ